MVDFCFKNNESHMIILRCVGGDNFFLERVLFPMEVFTFVVPLNSIVEIWGNELYGPTLEQRIRVETEYESSYLAA